MADHVGVPAVATLAGREGNNASEPSGSGAVLDDEKAYELFNNYCKEDFARGFKLYKLYERAAAFAGQPQ